MKLAHSLVAGVALAVSFATAASSADLLTPVDPIYSQPLFDFEGLYVGGTAGGVLSGTPSGSLGGVVGANFAVTDGIIAGVEFQGDTYWNGGGYAGYDALGLGRVGGFLSDNTMIYGDVGAGLRNNTAVYAVGGGVEMALTQQLSARGDLQGIGAFGGLPNAAKATAGLIWHVD